jgi:gliding motility-associated-like protein
MCITLLLLSLESRAEGSIDLLKYPGKRLFLSIDFKQQMKVYAKAGEVINIGSSHIGISGGFIEVYNPKGQKVATYDGSNGAKGIIFNDTQEKAGPTGGGTKNGAGYIPETIDVNTADEGIWSINFAFPGYELMTFKNLETKDAWTRAKDQPLIMRAILAWDITVSQNNAGNIAGSKLLKGRLYTNELITVVNENDNLVSPLLYVLTKDAYFYELCFKNVDPWGFPLSCNTVGIMDGRCHPTYKSTDKDQYTRVRDTTGLEMGKLYHYNPQSPDVGRIINNKIFLNPPADDLPETATVTEIYKNITHTTWLKGKLPPTPFLKDFQFLPSKEAMATGKYCAGKSNILVPGKGAYICFNTNIAGDVVLQLDLDNNGKYDEGIDISIAKTLKGTKDTIYWDGKYANGQVPVFTNALSIRLRVKVYGGEIHLMMYDIENNPGSITFKRMNGYGAPDSTVYYDHSLIGGPVSGNGTTGKALPASQTYSYGNAWGHWKLLDNWSYLNNYITVEEKINIAVIPDCDFIPGNDSDGDKIADIVDLDDDNDGISDAQEYCHALGNGFFCLPLAKDPSADEDKDGISNYLDANDLLINNNCVDTNNDGKCDRINAIYDTDGDNVPDHLDLDSDNDGITDLIEAQHNQPDSNNDGVIDGDEKDFGLNGLYDKIDSDPTSLLAKATTIPKDFDGDLLPDHDDVDSDNDGINDLVEAGYSPSYDLKNAGCFDLVNPDLTSTKGLTFIIAPQITGLPIARPIDTDKDGYPDWHDLDSDNDGLNDVLEANRYDKNIDPDGNGRLGTGKVPTINTIGQPTIKDSNNNPLSSLSGVSDADNDGKPDFRDLDSDNDNLNDVYESDKPDPDNDGTVGQNPLIDTFGRPSPVSNSPTITDTDNDGQPDFRDTDSDNDGLLDVNECNSMPCVDLDKDGKPAFRDTDRDGDGIFDGYECSSNGIACEDTDKDGIPDVDDLDSDNDKLPDAYECGQYTNCPDTDSDGTPDFRDLDSDGDTLPDETECSGATCGDLDKDGKPNFRDIDRDGDGIDDQYECSTKGIACEDTDNDGIPDVDDLDSDNDKLPDAYECGLKNNCPDTDGDGKPDFRDLDSDGDSLPDETECSGATCGDLDKDGKPNFRDIDRDGDGIDDQYECSTKGIACDDTDNDGIPDVDDLDSDNDGLPDAYECGQANNCPDWDKDGKPDFRDLDADGDGKPDKDECPTGAPCADIDNDGNPNFRDISCDKLLDQPVIVTNSPVCNGTIQMTITQDYINVEKIVWINGLGDTLSLKDKQLTLASSSSDAVSPFRAKITDKDGCSSPFSTAVDVKINNTGTDGKLVANDDLIKIKSDAEARINILANDDTSTKMKWKISLMNQPTHGQAIINNGVLVYIPDNKFFGEELINYKLCFEDCADICDEAQIKITVEKSNIPFADCHLPNILTPNGDGANDVLKISCAEQYPNSEITVYNRWGYIVHQQIGYDNNWGGTFKRELLPAGTYYYIYKPDRAAMECRMGYLTLIRE